MPRTVLCVNLIVNYFFPNEQFLDKNNKMQMKEEEKEIFYNSLRVTKFGWLILKTIFAHFKHDF